jgi:hypothetical protein
LSFPRALLADILPGYSLWAKDIVFVISDGHLDGMHAWLNAYHDLSQSSKIFFQVFLPWNLTECIFRPPYGTSGAVLWSDLDCAQYRLSRAFILSSRHLLWCVFKLNHCASKGTHPVTFKREPTDVFRTKIFSTPSTTSHCTLVVSLL